jgi:uncharacterized protein YndB with AHSA1/START domain
VTTYRVDQNTWVRRPVAQVFDQWTDPAAIPRYVPGVRGLDLDSPLHTRWHVRWLGLPRTIDIDVIEWVPDSRVGWRTSDGSLEGVVTFTAVNRRTTAVSIHVTHEPSTTTADLAAGVGVLAGRVRRTLVRFKHYVEAQDVAPVRRIQDRGEAPLRTEDLVPPPTGVPEYLGVTAGPAHAAGSPGGAGSMGLTSDRVQIGGRVGPADLAGVPPVPLLREEAGTRQSFPRA